MRYLKSFGELTKDVVVQGAKCGDEYICPYLFYWESVVSLGVSKICPLLSCVLSGQALA